MGQAYMTLILTENTTKDTCREAFCTCLFKIIFAKTVQLNNAVAMNRNMFACCHNRFWVCCDWFTTLGIPAVTEHGITNRNCMKGM